MTIILQIWLWVPLHIWRFNKNLEVFLRSSYHWHLLLRRIPSAILSYISARSCLNLWLKDWFSSVESLFFFSNFKVASNSYLCFRSFVARILEKLIVTFRIWNLRIPIWFEDHWKVLCHFLYFECVNLTFL